MFLKIKEVIDQPEVERFELDVEAASWTALRQVFPGIIIKGCVFHLTQAPMLLHRDDVARIDGLDCTIMVHFQTRGSRQQRC